MIRPLWEGIVRGVVVGRKRLGLGPGQSGGYQAVGPYGPAPSEPKLWLMFLRPEASGFRGRAGSADRIGPVGRRGGAVDHMHPFPRPY